MIELDLNFRDACFDSHYMYFSASDFNGLFRLKKGEKYAEWLGQFPEEDTRQKYLHYKNVKYRDKIFFTPFYGHAIHIYDLKHKTYKICPIDSKRESSFTHALMSNGKIYLIPFNVNTPFIIYDTEEETIQKDNNFWKLVSMHYPLDEDCFVGGFGAVLVNENIYITVVGLKIVITYNIYSKKIDIKEVPFWPRSISYFQSFFYFTDLASQKMIQCNIDMDINREIDFTSWSAHKIFFTNIIGYQGKLMVMPGRNNRDVVEAVITKEKIELNKYNLLSTEDIPLDIEPYRNYIQKRTLLLFLPRNGGGITSFDLEQKRVKKIEVKCDPRYAGQYRLLLKSRDNYFEEREEGGLREYLNVLKDDFLKNRVNRPV